MDVRINDSMAKHNLTYLDLLRNLAIDCDKFILFVRDKSFSKYGNYANWPKM